MMNLPTLFANPKEKENKTHKHTHKTNKKTQRKKEQKDPSEGCRLGGKEKSYFSFPC